MPRLLVALLFCASCLFAATGASCNPDQGRQRAQPSASSSLASANRRLLRDGPAAAAAAARDLLHVGRPGRLRDQEREERGALSKPRTPKAGVNARSIAGRDLLHAVGRPGRLRVEERAERGALPHAHVDKVGVKVRAMRFGPGRDLLRAGRQGRLRADDRTQRGAMPHLHLERAGASTRSMRMPKALTSAFDQQPPAVRQLQEASRRSGHTGLDERVHRDDTERDQDQQDTLG